VVPCSVTVERLALAWLLRNLGVLTAVLACCRVGRDSAGHVGAELVVAATFESCWCASTWCCAPCTSLGLHARVLLQAIVCFHTDCMFIKAQAALGDIAHGFAPGLHLSAVCLMCWCEHWCASSLLLQVTGLNELRALETQINEFGQTPKQLFAHPHPPRLVQPPPPDPATVFSHTAAAAAAGAVGVTTFNSSSPEPGVAWQGTQGRESPALSAPPGRPNSSSTSSKVRLKGGGEDAAGGAICFALLSTILAAAAPEIEPAARGPAAAGAGDTGLKLSPVSSADLSSAAPCSTSPAKNAAQQAQQLPQPALAQQQQQQQQVAASQQPAAAGSSRSATAAGGGQNAAGFRGMLSKLTEGAAAAAGSAAASVASAVQNSAGGSRVGLPLLPPGGDGRPGSMLASLSWMQQQLAEGLSLRNNSTSSTSSSTRTQGATTTTTQQQTQHSSTGSSSASASLHARPWPRNLPDKLLVKKSVKLQVDPLTAVAASADGSALFVAGHNGLLKVLDTAQLATHRSMKLENTDLLCISLMPTAAAATGARAASPAAAAAPDVGSGRGIGEASLPMVLAGAQSGRVLAYAATAGRMVGSWAAHDDAVSSILQLSHCSTSTAASARPSSSSSDVGPCRVVTASWDCCVKVWDVAEGRAPWSSTLPLPVVELRDLESGVWALSASASGQLLVTGTEEGVVAAWDLRTRQQIWATQVRRPRRLSAAVFLVCDVWGHLVAGGWGR